jgi:N-carbamoylputrescine amidase
MKSPDQKCVKVAAVQARCCADPEENKRRTIEQIRRLAEQGADIVCLQELFSSRYFCQSECHDHFSLAEPVPGPITSEFGGLAADLKIVIVATVFERRAAGVYHNSAVVLDTDGSVAGVYRKMHIPDDPCYYEKFYFAPGDLGFRTISTSKADLGVCICWDQWFPEAARLTALAGAQILVFPTAIGWLLDEKATLGTSQVDSWVTMMRSHAIANGVYVVAPNRVGREDQIEFWGNSFVADPYGNLLVRGPADEETGILADCDPGVIETARTHWPFLRDRRIDAYAGLTQRYNDQTNHG